MSSGNWNSHWANRWVEQVLTYRRYKEVLELTACGKHHKGSFIGFPAITLQDFFIFISLLEEFHFSLPLFEAVHPMIPEIHDWWTFDSLVFILYLIQGCNVISKVSFIVIQRSLTVLLSCISRFFPLVIWPLALSLSYSTASKGKVLISTAAELTISWWQPLTLSL